MQPYYQAPDATFYLGDVRECLANLPAESVHCCVTSPPYYGLRDYKIELSVWPDGWRGCLGLEPTPDPYVAHLVDVMRDVRRVLRKDATCWLNIGDSYAGSWGNYGARNGTQRDRTTHHMIRPAYEDDVDGYHGRPPTSNNLAGVKPKDLLLMPFRVALALQADGWWVRSDICWAKKAPMPESVTDRPTTAWEHIFLLSKSATYYYDAEAVREEGEGYGRDDGRFRSQPYQNNRAFDNSAVVPSDVPSGGGLGGGRNLRNFWLLSPEPLRENHYASYPTEIPRRAILAGTSEHGVCAKCGAPWGRVTARESHFGKRITAGAAKRTDLGQLARTTPVGRTCGHPTVETLGWRPSCRCEADVVPATVLDPFLGSGTTALVARQLGRRSVGIDLSQPYLDMAITRLEAQTPTFETVVLEL